MTDCDVAAFKFGCLQLTAKTLNLETDLLDAKEISDRIQGFDQQALILLDLFFNAYDDWFQLSKEMVHDEVLRADPANQAAAVQKMRERDKRRVEVLDHLFPLC